MFSVSEQGIKALDIFRQRDKKKCRQSGNQSKLTYVGRKQLKK